jgi:tetratricopeptide (TPR) repeat protein
MKIVRLALMAAAVTTFIAAAACNRDPHAKAAKHATRADAYAAKKQYAEAVIEYGNALKATPQDAAVRYKLGRAHDATGDPVKAYREYAHAADLDPSNLDAQMRAGTILLAAGEYQQARTRAELALKVDSKHVPALILLGNASAGLKETVAALRQIEQAVALDPTSAPAWSALGAVQFVGGKDAEAATAFQRAVAVAPHSVEAHLALSSYQWAKGAIGEAEATLKKALALEAGNSSAHRALALLYMTQRRAKEAEPHLRAAATDPAGRLALADYYAGVGNTADSLKILGELEGDAEKMTVRTARLRKAVLLYDTGDKPKAHEIVDGLLKDRPRDVEARLTKTRMLLAERATADAVSHATEAVKTDGGNPATHYVRGLAALAQNDLTVAERSFAEVARLNPRAAAAQIQLARIRLARGETAGAVTAAEAIMQARPGNVQGAVLLSQSLRASGQYDRAAREVKQTLTTAPDAVPLHLETGWIALHRRDGATAKRAFTRALATDPQSFDARSGLVATDLAARKIESARAQVATWRKENPSDPQLRLLDARVEMVAGQLGPATKLLTALVAEDPSQLDAYQLLGSIYAAQGKTTEAIAQYEGLAARSPSAATGAKTLIGMLNESLNDRSGARAVYEQVVREDPRAAVAANNLAWIYADEGKLDDALRLATGAREAMGRRPEAEDTLGWVYLQKGLPSQALASFERARERAPERAVYHYHVGLAQLKIGDQGRARTALLKALSIDANFSAAADAQKQLAMIPAER